MSKSYYTLFGGATALRVALFIKAGGQVTKCPTRSAFGRLVWHCTSHPTRNLPLSLGTVGRW
jgi:hypothetical protein